MIRQVLAAGFLVAGLSCRGNPPPPALRLSDDVRPTRCALDLTIAPERTAFEGRVSFDAQVIRPTRVVWLNATEIDITRAALNGRPARVIKANDDFSGLTTGATLAAGPLTIDVSYSGKINREKSRGLYAEKEGGDWYAYTLFESIDARRAFPCFDQPDAKIPWRLTFHVKRDHVALANAAIESETDEPGDMKKVVIRESRPLPSYLVAFVVGPFEVVDDGVAGRVDTPIRFVVPKGRSAELRYAREVTPRVLTALEDYFDMDYPYGKLDVAVVPRFWGTMEHPGLLAMGQPLTLIKPLEETRERKERYANILAHEMAHYWFGDLVTMAWWDDTWLNEALGEWMDAPVTDRAEPGWRFLDRQPDRAAEAMAADEKLSTKAIRQPVASKEAIESSFDAAITYMKGQTVLRMFESWAGPDRWRTFIRNYVRAYAWKNASADDFLGAMSAELGAPVADGVRSFLDQPGVPLIEHVLVCDGSPHLELRQMRSLPAGITDAVARTWEVPVCVRYGAKRSGEAQRACVLLTTAEGMLPLEGGCPSWLLMNAGGVGYYRSRYARDELRALVGPESASRTAMAERAVVLSDLDAAVARDQLGIADAMALVPAVLADPDDRIRHRAGGLTGQLDVNTLDNDTFARYQRWVMATFGPTARALGWRRRAGDSDERQELRAEVVFAVARAGDERLRAEADRLARAWLADPSALEDDVVDPVLAVAARDGDATLFDELLAQATAETDRARQTRLLKALGGFRDEALVNRALGLVLGQGFDLRESRALLSSVTSRRESRELGWRYIRDHVDELLGALRSDEGSWFVGDAAGLFCDEVHRKEADALFTPRASKIEGAQYTLRQALDATDQCIARQARIVPEAAAFLAGY